jgi:N6-adenosine-specific RNA methylase IME4
MRQHLFRLANGASPTPVKEQPSVGAVSSLFRLVADGYKFPTIYADPPWPYDNEASRAAAVNHYPVMSLGAIKAEPIEHLAAPNSHLHLWTTNAFLREAFGVIEAWGFIYKSCLVWVKPNIGMGNYWRVSHEYLLLGVRGSLTFRDRTLPSWIQSDRSVHSRKPAAVRTR